jgi:hypothetical protein
MATLDRVARQMGCHMWKKIKKIAQLMAALVEGLFRLLGFAGMLVARTPKSLLEMTGLLQPAPQMQAAEEAEEAAAQAKQQSHLGSALDKRSVVWTPEQKTVAITDWCAWRTGQRQGLEPSLAGFSMRERLKMKAADEGTIKVLPLRALPVIEDWLNSPKTVLEPLTPAQLETVKRRHEQLDREAAEGWVRWNAIVDRLDARHSASDIDIAGADDLLRETEEVLSFRPRGYAAA